MPQVPHRNVSPLPRSAPVLHLHQGLRLLANQKCIKKSITKGIIWLDINQDSWERRSVPASILSLGTNWYHDYAAWRKAISGQAKPRNSGLISIARRLRCR